jgi:hypothetical protein
MEHNFRDIFRRDINANLNTPANTGNLETTIDQMLRSFVDGVVLNLPIDRANERPTGPEPTSTVEPNSAPTSTENSVPTSTENSAPTAIPTRPFELVPPYDQIFLRQLDTINDIVYEYNRTFRDYNHNIQEAINLLYNVQNQYHLHEFNRSMENRNMFSSRSEFLRRPRSRETTIPIVTEPRMPAPVPPTFNYEPINPNPNANPSANLLFSYTFYPPNVHTPSVDEDERRPLTRNDIAQTTRTYGYTEDMSSNICPISLDPFRVGDVICEILGCRHIFKRRHLMPWLQRNSRCPVCRYSLRNYLQQHDNPHGTAVSTHHYENTDNSTDDANVVDANIDTNGYANAEENNQDIVDYSDMPSLVDIVTPPLSSSSNNEHINRVLQNILMLQHDDNLSRRSVFDASGREMYEFDVQLTEELLRFFADPSNNGVTTIASNVSENENDIEDNISVD